MTSPSRTAVHRALLLAAVVFIALQALPIVPIDSPVTASSAGVAAPAIVTDLLHRACFDCHSNETAWPWYGRIAPVSWLITRDVHQGRRALDFSAWNTYPTERQRKKLQESIDEVHATEMPPWFYALLHRQARLDAAERATLRQWMETEIARLTLP